jgi:uncharacterized membrane protein (DUF485 family)
MAEAREERQKTVFTQLGSGALILLMVFSALMLWIGIPLGWLIIGSHAVDSSEPSMGPYMLVFFGIVVSVIITARFISRVNKAYERVSGNHGKVRIQMPWMKSMRGEREEKGTERTVLDVVMVASVALAGAVVGVWFLFFAGSSIPGT